MRIVYLEQFFRTTAMIGHTRAYEIARRLTSWGHEVHMVTSSFGNTMNNPDYDDVSILDTYPNAKAAGRWYEAEEAGIKVHLLPMSYSNYMGYADRIKSYLRFATGAARKAASLKGDVIFATSPALTISLPAMYAARRSRTPFVFEVRDLWPEAPIQMGALTAKPLVWSALGLERLAYNQASHIVALSPGMKEGILAKGVPEAKVSVIPNSSDLDIFSPQVASGDFRARFGLENKFVCLYFGAMGEANGLSFVLDCAAELRRRGRDDIAFVLHGDGKERPMLEARQKSEGLTNVVFSGQSTKKEMAHVVASADITMTIFKNVPVLYTCSPNKMFDSFAAGKPVLTNMPGWLRDLVEEHQAGVFVEPDNVRDFAEKVVYLAAQPERCKTLGENSRKLAEEMFARDKLTRDLEQVLETQAKRS